MRATIDDLFHAAYHSYGIVATDFLVETLLERVAVGDGQEAKAAIDRLAAASGDEGLVIRDIRLLRMRALLARAQGDETAYRDYRDRYRAMATSLRFEAHLKWAEAMP
jgi:adenylate cyclase